jgi:hypothetical protein
VILAMTPEAVAGVAQMAAAQVVAEQVGVAQIVEFIAAALAPGQVMVDGAAQLGVVRKRQTADPAIRIDGGEYFPLARDRHGTPLSSRKESASGGGVLS